MFKLHKGALWMLIATFFFALMGTFVKLGGGNFTSTELVFYRSSISLVIIILIMRWNKINYSSKYLNSLVNLGKFNEAFKYSIKLEKRKLDNFESNLIIGIYYLKEKQSNLAQKYFLDYYGLLLKCSY